MKTTIKKTFFFIFLCFFFLLFITGILLYFHNFSFSISHFIETNFLHRSFRQPLLWTNRLQHFCFQISTIPAFFLFFFFTNLSTDIREKIKNTSYNFFHTLRSNSHILIYIIFTFFLLFITFFKLISIDYFFQDDYGRALSGVRDWASSDSRFISEFLSIIIHTNLSLPDIAPIPQIISLLIVFFSIFILSYIFTDGNISLFTLLSSSLLFINPFFSGNISYRFDAPYMALSYIFPILPFLFINNLKYFIVISFFCLEFTCMTYQAGTNIYIVLAAFLVFKYWISNKKNNTYLLKFIFSSILSYIVSLLFFKFIYMNPLTDDPNRYYSIEILKGKQFISCFLTNCITYIKITSHLYGNCWIKIFSILLILCFFITSIKYTKKNKYFTLFLSVLFLFFVYIFSFGVYLIFYRSLFAARTFIGFNCFICCICLFIFSFTNYDCHTILSYFSITFLSLLLYGNVIFMNVYANACKSQEKYQDFRGTLLLTDLTDYVVTGKKYFIVFDGSIGYSNSLISEINEYPVLTTLIPTLFTKNILWGDTFLQSFNFNIEQKRKIVIPDKKILLKDDFYHSIYEIDNLTIDNEQRNTFYIIMKNPDGIINNSFSKNIDEE
jgi:hypothetical protein